MSNTQGSGLGPNPAPATSAIGTIRKQRTFLGHPGGLYFLFFTEMWERFSYNGMRALPGLSFLPLIFISRGLRADQRVNLLWLVSCALAYTVGELYLAPVGYSLVSKVAPARLVSMLMGTWFLANFAGNYLAGYLGTFYEKMPQEKFFSVLMALGLAAGAAILALSVPIGRAVGRDVQASPSRRARSVTSLQRS